MWFFSTYRLLVVILNVCLLIVCLFVIIVFTKYKVFCCFFRLQLAFEHPNLSFVSDDKRNESENTSISYCENSERKEVNTSTLFGVIALLV